MDWKQIMIKQKCDRCGSILGTESKKTKQRFCGNCKRKFQLHRYQKLSFFETREKLINDNQTFHFFPYPYHNIRYQDLLQTNT